MALSLSINAVAKSISALRKTEKLLTSLGCWKSLNWNQEKMSFGKHFRKNFDLTVITLIGKLENAQKIAWKWSQKDFSHTGKLREQTCRFKFEEQKKLEKKDSLH